jgi:DNA-nicking Smr family endonuclease
VRGRRLNAEDAALWRHVTASVKPMTVRHSVPEEIAAPPSPVLRDQTRPLPSVRHSAPFAVATRIVPQPLRRHGANTLDAGWDKRLAKGQVAPDFTIDLHGETLTTAHARLNQSLSFALQQGARLILLITGRPARDNPRLPPTSRGVIRASIEDWLQASSYYSSIAAVRPAHPRHGGHGALYLIMRRGR